MPDPPSSSTFNLHRVPKVDRETFAIYYKVLVAAHGKFSDPFFLSLQTAAALPISNWNLSFKTPPLQAPQFPSFANLPVEMQILI